MKYLLLITLFFFQSSHLLWAQTQPNFYTRDSKTQAVLLKAKLREIEYQRRFRQQELDNQRLEIEYQRQLRQQELENQRREIEVRLREFENQRREVEGRLQECENQLRRLGAIRESQPGLQQFEIPKSSFVFLGDKMAKLDKGGTVSLEKLIVATLAQADALAKLLIEKGLIIKDEFMQKLSDERAVYQAKRRLN